jgi:hypothetical protein
VSPTPVKVTLSLEADDVQSILNEFDCIAEVVID